jgi:hypothetical protein
MGLKEDARTLALRWAVLAHGSQLAKSADGQARILQTADDFTPITETFLLAIDSSQRLAEHSIGLMKVNNMLTGYLTDIGRVLQAIMPDEWQMASAAARMQQAPQAQATSARVQQAYRRQNAVKAAEDAGHHIDPSGEALRRRYARPPDPYPDLIRKVINGHDRNLPTTRGKPDVPPYHPEATP